MHRILVLVLSLLLLSLAVNTAAAATPIQHWSGVVTVSYVEGRHLELVRGHDEWVLLSQSDTVTAKLEASIGKRVTVWGQLLEISIWQIPAIMVERVWLPGEPSSHPN